MKTIEFNLDTYKRIASGELIGSVQTRRGTKVYVQRINGEGEYPVIAQPEGSAVFYTYTKDGRIRANIDNEDDLVIKLKDKVMETKYVKVPFDLELAKKITNGEVNGKIITREGDSARILCWDKKDKTYPLAALVDDGAEEGFKSYTNEGIWDTDKTCTLRKYDLMLEIPEYMTFKDGDIVAYGDCDTMAIINAEFFKNDSGDICSKSYITILDEKNLQQFSVLMNGVRLATEEEKQKFVNILKESNELKAKIILKQFFGIEQKQECVFKPKDWVLTRDEPDAKWSLNIFSHTLWDEGDECYHYYCVGGWSYECIPYNDQTKHLLGTTDNWEE